jgi:UDP-N-acetylglucosamine--N-acetylmuramyl-(pentapeptide) pyrophosphoryl-undecaprenol N-acetylglucosamine transferase
VREIGNPVRREIAALADPAQRFAGRTGPIRILVVGGSLGAARLNNIVPQALAEALRRGQLVVDVRHQAGDKLFATARAAYAQTTVRADVSAFIEDMAAAYAWADLIICRAGALTVSELAAAGLGAILVPYPNAVDDHQTHNAEFLVQAGAAVRIADGDLTATRLATELLRLCNDRAQLAQMAGKARALARPDAAAELLRSCLAAAREAA